MTQEDLILVEEAPEEKVELEIVPDFSRATPDTSRRLKPSTTDYKEPDLAPHLEIVPIPGAERSETDDELFRRIESDIKTYKPTDDELDKYLDYKARQPKYAIDLIKGVWHGGKAVVGDLAKGVWGAVKDPELVFSPTPTGMLKRGATVAEGAARATWDLGTVGRYINDWFGEERDRAYRDEIEDMKLRKSNLDWKPEMKTRRWKTSTAEEKEAMRKSWSTLYIKKRINEDLQHLEETTNNFKDPAKDLKRDFNRSGLAFVEGETRDFYTSPEYINSVLSAKQREKYYNEFPKWINKRRRDRWRRGRYLMRTTELARAGEQTILGELFGPKVDEAAKAFVNSDVATLASYAGGPAEAGAVLSTKFARKAASPSALAGKATEKAGQATQWAGGKIKQFGEWATTSPEKSAAVGAALGVASGDDSISVLGGALGGLAEQRVKVVPTAGEMLQKAGTAVEAVGEVIAKPEGVEGLLKSASRVAKDEGVAERLNKLSWLDPALNVAGDLGKGAAVGSAFGAALTLPSGDLEVIGSGIGAGGVGGFAAAAPGRYLTRGARLKEQLQNEWSEFQKQLTPEQIENIKEYAPTLEEMGDVITTLRMVNGVIEGGGNIDFKILSPTDFAKAHGVQRGVVVTKNKTRPSIEINAGYKGPSSLYHEAWHALKRFAGETEIQKTPEGKQEVEVLKPHLEKIQTILFGKKLGDKTVQEGMFSEKDLVGGFYDQYASKMAPEERAAFEKQFELGDDGKKLTPAEADQKKLNYMMEEVEAESFRYLMSNTNPRQIAQGNRSLHQRFIDHMLLSEHSKTLRGMRKALETVGIDFKPSGQPSDIFMQKGQGITNSRELNAALRQYLRAWEGMQHRTRVMGDLEPSGFSIGGTGKAGRAQVEYHLSKKENDFLRDHFSSSDMLKKNKDGGVYYDPDGRVTLLTEGEIKKLQENRSEQIREKLSETDDGTGMVMMENGSFEGIPSPHQLDAIDRISNEIITPNQKQIIRETAEIMRNDPGAPIQFLYNAALGKGKTYSSSLSSTHRTAVPLGFHISKAQNFYFTSLDLGAYHRKISAWGDPTKKALHKGGHKLALWDKDVRAFEADLFNYLDNHKHGRKGAEGLDPDAQVAEMKRNVLNDFFDINRNKEEHGNFNPVTAARRAIDPKTGKQKKRAYRGLENLIRSYRLDRVLDENFGKSFSYALGEAIPMKSGGDFYQQQLKNLMPAPSEGTFNKAKENFGTTKDPLEAGYVLPDGEMLDFSGRHEGADERDIKGWRYSDHRDISQIGTEMTPFIDSGAVRIDVRNGLIELGKDPTASQLNVIRKIIEDKNSEVFIDLKDSNKPDVADWFETIQPEPGTDPKRVIGLIRRFYRGDDISGATSVGRFMPAPTFYSKAERAVEASQQKTMSVKQAVALATKDIPKAEYEWSGVVDWLEGRKEEGEGKVSKAELLEFLQNKGVKVEEVVRRSSEGKVHLEKVDADEVPKEYKNIYKVYRSDDPEGEHYGSEGEIIELADAESVRTGELFTINMPNDPKSFVYKFHTLDSAKKYIKSSTPYASETLFKPGESDWVMLPGGENYGELVLTLPDSNANQRNTLRAEVDRRKSRIRGIGNEIKKLEIKMPTEHELKEGLLPSVESWLNTEVRPKLKVLHSDLDLEVQKLEPFTKRLATLGPYRETFELPSSHRFPESNILVHIRFTERIDADGKRMLFIEELQSDWSNTGRSDGWKQERPAEVQKEIQRLQAKKRKKMTRDLERLDKELKEKYEDTPTPFHSDSDKIYTERRQLINKVDTSEIDGRIAELEEKYPYNPSGAPDMPFKGDNRYGALAMKRMIRWAADNGYDRLGWITGKDTAERYNLSKQIDRIELEVVNDEYKQPHILTAYDLDGNSVLRQMIRDESEIESYIGKGVAKKLLEAKAEKVEHTEGVALKTLSNLDLDISPEWPINLYDKVLPSQAKKIVKKKGAVGRTRLGDDTKKRQELADELKETEGDIDIAVETEKLNAGGRYLTPDTPQFKRFLKSQQRVIDLKQRKSGIEQKIKELDEKGAPEANYVDITPEVKALAEEGFSYFMPPGAGRGRAAAPAQPAPTLPATPIMPKVKLTDEEKEDSRRLLNLLKEKGI